MAKSYKPNRRIQAREAPRLSRCAWYAKYDRKATTSSTSDSLSASRLLILVILVLLSAHLCIGQQVTVLTNVTVIDGTGKPAQPNRDVAIQGDHILSITPAGQPAAAGATLIDLRGKTIMPELINTHGHLGLIKGTTQLAANQTDDNVRHQLLRYQCYGVGAVLSMGTDGEKFAAWREASRNGAFPGAAIYTAGIGFGAKDGVPPASMGFTQVLHPVTPEEARAGVRKQAPLKPDFIKFWLDDFWGQYPKMKPEIYAAIIDEAHRNGLPVAAHVYYLEDARKLVDLRVDVLAHSVRDGEIDNALLTEMKQRGVTYIPTLSLDDFAFAYDDSPAWVKDPFFQTALEPGVLEMITSPQYKEKLRASKVTAAEKAALPVAQANLKKVFDAGIPVSMGTDSGATPIRVQGFAEHMELALMVQAGLTPLQAITVATKNGAELLKISDQVGTLEPGKKADFIVLDADPSQDIENTRKINSVWKNGRKVNNGPHDHCN
jgi:imidazolonepropionase-like amidohydrolase